MTQLDARAHDRFLIFQNLLFSFSTNSVTSVEGVFDFFFFLSMNAKIVIFRKNPTGCTTFTFLSRKHMATKIRSVLMIDKNFSRP